MPWRRSPPASRTSRATSSRIGAPLTEAVAAFPEGTFLRVVSSGEYFYEWSTREGGTIRFRADRDFSDPAAVITGVTVEDATLRTPFRIE